jgi:hypothetical protein
MRLISWMALALCLSTGPIGCADEADACANVAVVCKGDTKEQTARTACESAASNADQSTLNCVDAANSCDAALACTTPAGN